jgi:hypothetical protein
MLKGLARSLIGLNFDTIDRLMAFKVCGTRNRLAIAGDWSYTPAVEAAHRIMDHCR